MAYDPVNGDCGVAVASRYFSVGAVVPWAEAGVGCIATQANVNVGYGPRGLELLRQGLTAKAGPRQTAGRGQFPPTDGRQVAIIDRNGNIAAYTGPNAPTWAGDRQGKNWSAQGNILAGPQVPEAMGRAFEATEGELAEKLFAALKAGDDAGGDSRGKQSASMLVVRKGGGRNINNDRYHLYQRRRQPAAHPRAPPPARHEPRHAVPGKGGPPAHRRQGSRSARRRRQSRPVHANGGVLHEPGRRWITVWATSPPRWPISARRWRWTRIRRQFDPAAARPGRGQRMRPILEDKEFLKQLFPGN